MNSSSFPPTVILLWLDFFLTVHKYRITVPPEPIWSRSRSLPTTWPGQQYVGNGHNLSD